MVTIAVTIWWLSTSRPQAVPVVARRPSVVGASAASPLPTHPVAPGASPSGSTAKASAGAVLVVDVAGKVRRPGIYRLPAGARVFQAIRAAGGARRGVDLLALNLAAPVQDGQQIVVGRAAGAVPTALGTGAGTAGGTAGVSAPVNLNTASLEQLDTLPGVGPVLAQHILDWRTQHGRFDSVAQLDDVSGIGGVKFDELRNIVTV